MIKITQLTKEYTLKNSNQTTAIENINLELDDKGLVFLLGKSGSVLVDGNNINNGLLCVCWRSK